VQKQKSIETSIKLVSMLFFIAAHRYFFSDSENTRKLLDFYEAFKQNCNKPIFSIGSLQRQRDHLLREIQVRVNVYPYAN
jgi:hypothetical protein